MITLKLEVTGGGIISLPVENHVHQRVEYFTYDDDIGLGSVALDYIESKAITPANNLRINNKTGLIPRNASQLAEGRTAYDSFYGNSYQSYSWDILATNVAIVDEEGLLKPLFWKHRLPANTTEVSIEQISRGNRNQVDTGYFLDLESGFLFTNYQNFFDPVTGAYRLFYVVSVNDVGATTHELLSPVPATEEATWTDLDPDTGLLYTSYPLYTRERGTGQNTFTFNVLSHWYVRALGRALIQPRMPMSLDANSSWFLRITNGDFWATTGGPPTLHQYTIPEYSRQPFTPSAPYIFGSYEELEYVNESILKFPRDLVSVGFGRPLTVYVRSYDGELLKVLTTDGSLHGKRFGREAVYYESDKILNVDNSGGFVSLGIKLLPSWQYTATYHYQADDYEYTGVDLNPVYNKTIRNRMVAVYCKPDLTNTVTDTSIYHLVVDRDGVVLDANEPALALKNPGPNPNTIVGRTYGEFLDEYTVSGTNSYAYTVLAELIVDVAGDVRDSIVYDVRQAGGRPADEAAIKRNPRIVQSSFLDNEHGMIVPRDNVVIIEPPITLLEDYGGALTKSEAEAYLTRHLDMTKLAVIRWEYPRSRVTGTQTSPGNIELTASWDGPGEYRTYRRNTPSDTWALVDSVTQNSLPVGRRIAIMDTLPGPGVYYYCVRVYRNGIEFPEAYSLAIEA